MKTAPPATNVLRGSIKIQKQTLLASIVSQANLKIRRVRKQVVNSVQEDILHKTQQL
jgi:hypothetical protein